MIRSILVPLDGSTFGEHALPLAAGLARRAGAGLHLAHVHQVVPPATVAGVAVMSTLEMHLRQDEQAYLADVVRRLNEKGPVEAHAALLEGEVAAALREEAARVEAGLVVMATHGRGAMGRFWLGSVTDDMLAETHLPLLLVRPSDGRPDLKRDAEVKNILAPLDGSEEAEQILEPALALGQLFGAGFTLVQVVKPVLRDSYLPEGGTLEGLAHTALNEIRQMEKKVETEAAVYLDCVADKLRRRGATVAVRVVVDEQPAAAILREAQLRHAGLIALQTHGRRGLSRLLRGSVADKVVRGGSVAVLLNHI